MHPHVRAVLLAGAALSVLVPSSGASAASASGGWGTAEEVPGAAVHARGGQAAVLSVSCPSAGNCSAGGYYLRSDGTQGFVVSRVHGTWGTAEEVPGLAKLNAFGIAEVTSVSCASAGNCSAGGNYQDGNTGNEQEAFVASQAHGTWGKAEEVPGTGRLNTFGGTASVTSVSCGAAGNCSALGYYTDDSDNGQVFVASEVNGIWGKAEEVPGTATLNTGGADAIHSVSCASAGNCSAGGYYVTRGHQQAFVVSQVNGTWGKAEKIRGVAVTSVSCASAGNCSAGGYYRGSSGHLEAFVVSEVDGVWGKTEEVPGTATLNHGNAGVSSVSCASVGNCGADGYYTDSSGHHQAFVVSQVERTWGKAEEIPGTAALNKGSVQVKAVSCASVGNCGAGGSYTDGSGHQQAFVVSQVNGTWGKAEEVPGTAALNASGQAAITSVSCGSPGNCGAGGFYTDRSDRQQAFVVSRT
jgi:hypothetical protein